MDSEIRRGQVSSVHTSEAGMPTCDQFGPSRLGQKVFNFIKSGVPCERIISDPNGEPVTCGKPAIGSVDHPFDVVLVCSSECSQAVKERIEKEAMAQGRQWRLGCNGFNRP